MFCCHLYRYGYFSASILHRQQKAKIFKEIYFSIEEVDGIGVYYTKTGEFSATVKIVNPVQKYCADINEYYSFSSLLTSLMSTLGEGYAIHKQDVFVRKGFEAEGGNKEFLSESYFRYFGGREYTDCITYLTITQENKKSRLMSYDNKKWQDFQVKLGKVQDQLRDRGIDAHYLNKKRSQAIHQSILYPKLHTKESESQQLQSDGRIYWYWFQKIQDLQLSRC